MLIIKRFVPILGFFLSGCIVVPTYTGRVSLQPTNYSEQEVDITNVLLVGTGPIASRMFLDNLSSKMMETFKRKGVSSEFSYIGKVPQLANLKLDSLVTAPFDACLVFKASDDVYLNMTKVKYTGVAITGATVAGYGNQYKDKYTVSLYTKKEGMQLVWQGDLKVDFDLAEDSRYNQISNLIFKELSKKRILP
ncbi:hypothetical protein [Flavisolibacter tropicus]|nr:hypothetical protein [Flavisolibacter tropicus]